MPAAQIEIAKLEQKVNITFSNKEVIELTNKQYTELLAMFINDVCKDCIKRIKGT